jgi:ABC-type antimicrobial peptide transport system permease subunit
MSQLVRGALAQRRFSTALIVAFAMVALVLATVGLYGVVAYSVAQRRQEFGIRMALGASARRVLGLVVGQGLRPVLLGATVGLVAALFLTRLMSSMLFGVRPGDPLTILAVISVLAPVALLASVIPARRALRVHPAEALRSST